MKKFLKYFYMGIFILIGITPAILFTVGLFGVQKASVNIEKRENIEFPSLISNWKINDSFDDECEAWLNQNVPFRDVMISDTNVVLSDVLKGTTSNVVTGLDGWIYSVETVDDYMDTNSFSEQELRNIGITLSLIQEEVELNGGRFLFAVAPNKNTVYPENMPKRYLKAEENNLDRLYTLLDQNAVNYVNLKDSLLTAKEDKNNGNLYYKRDTHWTACGALVGYESIMDKLGKVPITIDKQSYSMERTRRSDLDKLLYPGINRLDEEYIVADSLDYDSFEFIFPQDVTDTKAQLENFMSDKEDHDNNFTTRKKAATDESILYMIRDSFARALLPYMIDSFDQSTFIRSVTPSFENVPDNADVVYEICERNLENVISSAPYLFAPRREAGDTRPVTYGSDKNSCTYSDEGYAYRIYGTIDPAMLGEDGRIFVRLYDKDSQVIEFEAFPIFEKELLKEANEICNISGYSLYINKLLLNEESYTLRISSGNYESNDLAEIQETQNDSDELSESEQPDQNPYPEENAIYQLEYRGATIGIGDNIRTLTKKLGDQAAPPEVITSCLSGMDAILYYYPGITIEADTDGDIYYISLMDNSYTDGMETAVTASGIAIGSDKMDIFEKLGKPYKENDKNCTYLTEHMSVSYSYKSGKVNSVILEDRKFISDEALNEESAQEASGVEYDSGNAYLYDDDHLMKTGWRIIDGEYYFFDRLTGERIVDQTIDGIAIGPDGEVNLSDYEKSKIETMMKAHKVLDEVTLPTDTMEEKRRKVFDWVLSFPYNRPRRLKDVYKDEGVEILEANDIFDDGAGDCVSESAAVAFLFHEIGYNNVYWVHDTGHSWVRSDDRLFDPLFAESRGFDINYDAEFTDYRGNTAHSMLIY